MNFVGRGGTKGGNRPHEKRSDGRSKWTYVSKVAVFSTFYELLNPTVAGSNPAGGANRTGSSRRGVDRRDGGDPASTEVERSPA